MHNANDWEHNLKFLLKHYAEVLETMTEQLPFRIHICVYMAFSYVFSIDLGNNTRSVRNPYLLNENNVLGKIMEITNTCV
jgi:hypothetical protein